MQNSHSSEIMACTNYNDMCLCSLLDCCEDSGINNVVQESGVGYYRCIIIECNTEDCLCGVTVIASCLKSGFLRFMPVFCASWFVIMSGPWSSGPRVQL